LTDSLLIALGVLLLYAGGELLVRNATRLALAAGMSALTVGLTVVASGTTSPELAITLTAAVRRHVPSTLPRREACDPGRNLLFCENPHRYQRLFICRKSILSEQRAKLSDTGTVTGKLLAGRPGGAEAYAPEGSRFGVSRCDRWRRERCVSRPFRIRRAFGIDVRVHWTFFLLLVFFAFVGYRVSGSLAGGLVAVGIIAALFACVLLHELGHSVVAQRLGVGVRDITLLPIGGLARLKSFPERPLDEVRIAVAGPLVNVVLAPAFFGAALLLGAELSDMGGLSFESVSVGQVLLYLGFLNVLLAVFNMVPAFPMDGGRVLRGLLSTRLGTVRATDIVSAVGQSLGIVFFLTGLLGGRILLALIAVFIFFGAAGETRMVRRRETMRGLTVSDVMGVRDRTETVAPYQGFGRLLDLAVRGYQKDFPVVDDDGKLAGMVTRDEISAAVLYPNGSSDVRDLMKTGFPTVSPGADLFRVGELTLQESGLRALPVVENGEVVGMLTVEGIGRASLLRQPPGKL